MKPTTHILSDTRTIIPCSTHFPPAYMDSSGTWFTQNPVLKPVAPPEVIHQNLHFRAKNSTLYSEDAKKELDNIIHFGHNKEDLMNRLTIFTCTALKNCNHKHEQAQLNPTFFNKISQQISKAEEQFR